MSNEASVFAEYEPHRIRKRKQQVIVGDSLLKGTGLQMRLSDSLSMDVCCLLGLTWIWDIGETLPKFVQPSGYYPAILPC